MSMMMTAPSANSAKKMGLLPLEFADCLLDSPYFRENLRAHEKQLDQTSGDIKGIIKDVQDVVDAARNLSKAKRTLASSLANFQFDCLGTSLTDDEIIIANSLREFSKFLNDVEDEMDRMLEHAHEKFILPLVTFRKEQIGSVRKTKKDFDKATSKFCTAQDNYIKSKKEESLAEAAESVRYEQKGLRSASLEYVYLMHVVQERKKFDFVEALLGFMHSWSNYYHYGHDRTEASSPYMNDLKSRVQRSRKSFAATIESYDSLKDRMVSDTTQDPGVFNPMYTRQGYIYVQIKKQTPFPVGSQWAKHYCQYQAKSKTLTMIPYTQLNGKITTTETVKVTSCVCKSDDSAEKFRFVVQGEDLSQGTMVTYTLQAMSEFERKHWVEALGGTWPAVNTLQKLRADSVEENLNSTAFTFLKDCLHELESRGLTDQGLYRVGGVVSKVKNLLNEGLIGAGDKAFDLSDPKQWESKTIASAVKQYFRDLNKPLTTHTLYGSFVEAVKHENEAQRLQELMAVMKRLPLANREMLKVLMRHLNKVSVKHEKNLMTAGNLGVCFGPTLLRPREETVASIMDIKFCNEVVEILIENCDTFFPASSDSSPEVLALRKNKGKAPAVPRDSVDGPDHHRQQRGSSTPKRTHSFSSFSQLSTNSLPDIHSPTVLTIAGNGQHHHHRHYHHHGGHTQQQQQQQQQPQKIIEERSRSKSHHHDNHNMVTVMTPTSPTKHVVLRKLTPPSRPLVKATSKDDDLMASLEMMNSLAADLPQNGGGSSMLKRSFTVQHRRGQRLSPESIKKPPLPKLSLGTPSSFTPYSPVISSQNNHNSSDTSSTGSSASSAGGGKNTHSTTARQVLASRLHSSPSAVTSGSSPNIHHMGYPTSPRPNRPKELFVRQITLPMEQQQKHFGVETPIVPSPSLAKTTARTPTAANSSGQVPPPIPARRYPRVYHQIHLNNSNTDESEPDQRRGSESSPRGPTYRSTMSADSGILTSPSPPTDSGIGAMSPPTLIKHIPSPPEFADKAGGSMKSSDDTVSICSSSESDSTSGSRYDNVPHKNGLDEQPRRCSNDSSSKTCTLVAAAAEIAAKRVSSPTRETSTQTIHGEDGEDGEDGDDEDEASDTSSDILVLDSSSGDGGKRTKGRRYEFDDIDDDLLEEEEDGSQNHDEIEITDHFRRRGNSRRKFRDSGPYDNFVLPGSVLPPSSVSSSVDTPLSSASSPSPASSPRQPEQGRLEPASIKRLLAAGQTSNV